MKELRDALAICLQRTETEDTVPPYRIMPPIWRDVAEVKADAILALPEMARITGKCKMKFDDVHWITSCGKKFSLVSSDDGEKFCPYCGKEIELWLTD